MRQPQNVAMDLANAIPGCSADRAMTEGNTVVSMRVVGWGPSLHRTGMAWSAMPATMGEDDIVKAFQPYVDIQQRRIALARSLGLSDDRQPDATDLSHMVADRLLLGFDMKLRADASRHLARLARMSRSGRNEVIGYGDTIVATAGALPGDESDDPRPRLLQQYPTDWGEYDGQSLVIQRTLPETIITAMTGRRLGDVIEMDDRLDPELDGLRERTIIGAQSCAQGIRITTRPKWTAIV